MIESQLMYSHAPLYNNKNCSFSSLKKSLCVLLVVNDIC